MKLELVNGLARRLCEKMAMPIEINRDAGEWTVVIGLHDGYAIALVIADLHIVRMGQTGILFAWRLGLKVARFRQVNKGRSNAHHDALEFPDGRIVLLTQLCKGQHTTVLQLPVTSPVKHKRSAEAPLARGIAGH